MTFRETGNTDAEAALIGVRAAVVELANECDEVRGVRERVLATVVVRKIARRIFNSRVGAAKSSLKELYRNYQRLVMGSSVLQIAEPSRWVAYGFTDADVLPPWMRNRLINGG